MNTLEQIDFKLLAAAGGPVSYSKQLGYGVYFLTSTTVVFGDNYDQVKVTFANSAGSFPIEIFLSPQNTILTNQTTSSGLMTLTVDQIQLFPPTPDTAGYVQLSAHWTDLTGQGKYSFSNPIAKWTNPPKA